MGCYFYIQDRGVHTLGEEIHRTGTGLWPLLSRMYRVSWKREPCVRCLLLHSQDLGREKLSSARAPAQGGGRGAEWLN